MLSTVKSKGESRVTNLTLDMDAKVHLQIVSTKNHFSGN